MRSERLATVLTGKTSGSCILLAKRLIISTSWLLLLFKLERVPMSTEDGLMSRCALLSLWIVVVRVSFV